jgi:hypothetical protein
LTFKSVTMKVHLFIALALGLLSICRAQSKPDLIGTTAPAKSIDLRTIEEKSFDPLMLKVGEIRKPAGDYAEKKEQLHQQRSKQAAVASLQLAAKTKETTADPLISSLLQFNANLPNGTPNDNSCAISDSGYIVSVVNTNMVVYNDTGKQLLYRNLGSFASSLSLPGSISDPRVIYDPLAKKFIMVFFSGNNSTNSTIVVAFSKTSNPLSPWNFYAIDGNPKNDTTWSDYPIISITKDDFFVTFNHLKDNESWKAGFRYSAIWQIDKERGYNGDSLKYNFWNNIKHNGSAIWSVCPVMKSGTPADNKSYFLSVRPSALSNDTVFLHTISNSYKSGNAVFSTQVLKTNLNYGLAPDAIQKDLQRLATNDARVLHAIELNNKIFYVQNCIRPSSMNAGIYLGSIDQINSNPIAIGKIIGYDSMELGYPAIVQIGKFPQDEKCLIYVNFVKKNGFAGAMALYKDKQNNISAPLILKEGEGNVNRLLDSAERWGDYSGIQQYYQDPTAVLVAGYYARINGQHGTLVAKVVLLDSNLTSSITPISAHAAGIFPNPTIETFNVSFDLTQSEKISAELFNLKGERLKLLLEDFYNPGKYQFQFNLSPLAAGTYLLKLSFLQSGETITKQIIKSEGR